MRFYETRAWELLVEFGFLVALVVFVLGASVMNTELIKGAVLAFCGVPFVIPAIVDGYLMNKED